MQIAMVSQHASPWATLGAADTSGHTPHAVELARTLGAEGHDVTIYTPRREPDAPRTHHIASSVRIRHAPSDVGEWLSNEFARHRPDLVHSHSRGNAQQALRAAQRARLPFVQTFHSLATPSRSGQQADAATLPQWRAEDSVVARGADMVIATSTAQVTYLRSCGVATAALTMVPCGVDPTTFLPEGPAVSRGRRPRVVTVGRVVSWKGIETVVRAMAAVPGAELLIAGGPARTEIDSDPEAARLRQLVSDLGLAPRVRFLGRVPHERVPALLRSADVAVNVPWYEPFGIATVEAMACGVPVVAAAVGGQLDTMIHEVTGLLVPPRSPGTLSRHLRVLLADAVLRESYGIAGADRAAARYAWPLIARQTLDCYRRVLARAPAARDEPPPAPAATRGGS
ncbi:glycosyltransferase [Salinactinospora qingdaonensis]|uniref:Glycosyltransferase family 1 protein n=1 Tax=Salinactinospora qingdaonensis TaxID=702744 RepID=A0ABP7FLX8_9ACTN